MKKKWKDKSGVTSDSVLYNYNTDGSWEEKGLSELRYESFYHYLLRQKIKQLPV